jgi:glycosyltransferase involved in cell wall biosynthesis
MILFCELNFRGRAHVPFNAGLLATVRAAFPEESLFFWGAATHIEELKKELGQQLAGSVVWKIMLPPTPNAVYSQRFFQELTIMRTLFITIPHGSTSRLILTSAHPSTVVALKVARWFWSRHTPLQIVLHGMSGVIGKRYRNPIRRFQDMRTALMFLGNKNIQYLVLERSIRDTAVKNLPFLSDRIEALEHPLCLNISSSQAVELSEPIRFGFLGLADKAKGFSVFVELANYVTGKFGQDAEFHAIGHMPANAFPMNGIHALATRPGTTLMDRADFIRRISLLHFVVLPHEAAAYTLTASGILLDAIAWEKPVIARRIPIFEAFFEKHGDIGYLFNDDLELRYIIEEILQTADKSRYHRQVLNLGSARKLRMPESLAASYRQLCGGI